MDNPYSLLGLRADASLDEIRAAYRRLAAEWHPDVHPPEKKPWASEQMVQLNTARDLLLDPARRAAYDTARARATWAPTESWSASGDGAARWTSAGGFTYAPPVYPRRPVWLRRIPMGTMFIIVTCLIVAAPYVWLLLSLATGTTAGFVAGVSGMVSCISGGGLVLGLTMGLGLLLNRLFRR